MSCNRCGAATRVGQRFCAECGAALAGDTGGEPPRPAGTPEDGHALGHADGHDDGDDPTQRTQPIEKLDDGPPTQPMALVPTDRATDGAGTEETPIDRQPTEPAPGAVGATSTEHRSAPATAPAPRLYDLAVEEPDLLRAPVAVTTEQPAPAAPPTAEIPAATQDAPRLLESDDHLLGRFRIGVVSAVGIVTGMTALFGMFLRIAGIRTDARTPTFATGDWMVADLGTNLPGAMLVALVALLVGVVGAGFRQRWAAGLAGGAGLAIAGWVTLTIGLAERPIEAAVDAVGRPTAEAFTVTITRDVGYWVLLAAGALGVVTFVVSLASAGRDRARRGLNPWIASLGAVAAVVAAAGPLIPEGTAVLQDNWSPGTGGLGQPTWYVVGRLVQLGLLAYAGVIGFLLVRSYGLGLVIGGITASVWLALSALIGFGEAPIGPGFANPGAGRPTDLHAVTIVGMTALVGLVIVAVIAAVEQAARAER